MKIEDFVGGGGGVVRNVIVFSWTESPRIRNIQY